MIEPSDEELDAQIQALQALKAARMAQQKSAASVQGALFEDSVQAGRDVIGRDLIKVVQHIYRGADEQARLQEHLHLYLYSLARRLNLLELSRIDKQLDKGQHEPLPLGALYVPLSLTQHIPAKLSLADWLAQQRQSKQGIDLEKHEQKPVAAMDAVACHATLVLIGDAGSGKSTVGARALLALAEYGMGQSDALSVLGPHWQHGGLLPVQVLLRQFSDWLDELGREPVIGDVWGFLRAKAWPDLAAGLSQQACEDLQTVAQRHGALFFFDGLDECSRPEQMLKVQALLAQFARQCGPQHRFISTARPYAWQWLAEAGRAPQHPEALQGQYELAALDETQAQTFVRAWYRAQVSHGWLTTPAEAQALEDDLLPALAEPHYQHMAQRPLLLTLMAVVHSTDGRLPQGRVPLFGRAVDLLLERWNDRGRSHDRLTELLRPEQGQAPSLDDVRQRLAQVAFDTHFQAAQAPIALSHAGAADISEGQLLRAFRNLLDGSADRAQVAIDFIERKAGLLVGRGFRRQGQDQERQFGFPHRSFQEFLAAEHLAASEDYSRQCCRLAAASRGHWALVLAMAASLAKKERGMAGADSLMGGEPPQPPVTAQAQELALVAATQAVELGSGAWGSALDDADGEDRKRHRTVVHLRQWLQVALRPHDADHEGLPAPLRAEAARALARLGDPRFDLLLAQLPADPQLGFVFFAANPGFRIGTPSADRARLEQALIAKLEDDEVNDAPTPHGAFWMARYPVTVAQFAAYVQDSAAELTDARALRGCVTEPVRYVTWHEACDYACWLQRKWQQTPAWQRHPFVRDALAQGLQLALPSELEWEAAARVGHAQAQLFPWGDDWPADAANANGALRQVSPVGCFRPQAQGVHELIGNVWEWTRSSYQPYPLPDLLPHQDPTPKTVVVRGGAFFDPRDFARCGFRVGFHPDDLNGYLGFRLVLRSSHVPLNLLLAAWPSRAAVAVLH